MLFPQWVSRKGEVSTLATRLSVRGLTEGAVLAALVALFAIAARYFPVFSFVSILVCPLPLTLLVIRHGLRAALLAAAVSAAIGAMVADPLTGAAILVSFAPVGIVIGLGARQGRPAAAIVFAGSVAATISSVVNLGLLLAVAGVNPFTQMFQAMEQGLENAVRVNERLGLDRGQTEQFVAQMRLAVDLLPRVVPLLLVIGGVFSAWATYQFGRFALRRLGQHLPALPPLSAWRVPGWFLWAVPLGAALLWYARASPVPFPMPAQTLRMLPPDDVASILRMTVSRYPLVEAIGLNLSVLGQMVFSVLGLVVAWVLMARYRLPSWLRWFIIIYAFFIPLLGLVAFVLGLADAAFGLRQRWRLAMETEAQVE